MTAIELIKILQEFPENTKVLVEGYETGYDDIPSVDEIVVYYRDVDWWDGNYEETEYGKMFYPEMSKKIDAEAISAVVLRGKSR